MLAGHLAKAKAKASPDAAAAAAVALGRIGNEELRRVNQQLVDALARQQELQEELKRLSETDPLTGLSNRRHLRAALDRELVRITRVFRPLTVLLLDVDRFKLINDGHGHAVGDEVLVELARRLRAVTREADSVGRWGGEEFCIALYDTDLAMSRRPAEAVLEAVRATPFPTRAGPISVTMSIGVASLSIDRFDVDELMSEADSALYVAKSLGRDRIVYGAETKTGSP
jgi:diguanylate cyclase (GGDEF)-like protein